jgi:hypothetical protein
MKMKRLGFAGAAIMAAVLSAHANAQQVLLSNNFNQPNGNFDNGPLTEYGGTLGGSVVMASQKVEATVVNDQLSLKGTPGVTTGEIRFDNYGSTGATPSTGLFDFSQGATGSSLLAGSGMQISFNWTPVDSNNDDWLALDNGVGTFNVNYTVVDGATDSGLLLRDDGTTTIFQQGAGGTGTTPGSTLLPSDSVVVDYYYNSFANGSPVTMDAYVNGTLAATENFAWTNASDYLQLDSDVNGELISNFAISTISPVPEPASIGILAIGSLGLLARRRRTV